MIDGRMSEMEWLDSMSVERMLAHLGSRASERKKRLFACACVRRIWPLLGYGRLRKSVELAERYADGQASAKQLQRALPIVGQLREELEAAEQQKATWKARAVRAAAQAVEALLLVEGPILEPSRDIRDPPDVVSATRMARAAARVIEAQREERRGPAETPSPATPLRRLETLDAVDLLREIFGNPFRTVSLDPTWLAQEDSAIVRMARAMYEERRFENLPILADVLEEAGCTDADMLMHCRAPIEHVRGCWVVDALLGMK